MALTRFVALLPCGLVLIVSVVVLFRVCHSIDPDSGVVDVLEIEAAGVEQVCEIDVAAHGLDNLGVLLEAADDGFELCELFRGDCVGLVENQCGAKFNLLDDEGDDVVLFRILVDKVGAAVELVKHTGAVHNGDDVVEGHGCVAVLAFLAKC